MSGPLNDDFPFARVLSLHKLIDFWVGVGESDTAQGQMARDLVERTSAIPDLLGATSASALRENEDLVAELMTAAFPAARSENWIAGAMTPFSFEPVFGTDAFKRLLAVERWHTDAGSTGFFGDSEGLARAKAMNGFHLVLARFYNVVTNFHFPTVFRSDQSDGLHEYYRIHIDPTFIDINCLGELPELTADQLRLLVDHPVDRELWTKLLPPHLFEFRGFVVITLIDVSDHEIHSLLKGELLQRNALTSTDRLENIEQHMRSLLRIPDLRIGIIGLPTGRFDDIQNAPILGRSLLLHGDDKPSCSTAEKSSYAQLFETGKPVVIADLEDCEWCTGFEFRIRCQSFRGLMLAPLRDGDRMIGIVELATAQPNVLTPFSAVQIMGVVDLFSAAMARSLDERRDRIQALIKQHFTSIHPSVEWRFKNAAAEIDRARETGIGATTLEDIVFESVYPLYGLSDIRDSSIQRNAAIRDDLLEQLGLALAVVVEASAYQPLPALDELGYRITRFADGMEAEISSDVEIGAIDFLQHDVEPLFDRLHSVNDSVRSKIAAYKAAIDPRIGVLYSRRRQYEESVAIVNHTISAFLDRREVEAQAMFPHYFERYETDGVDFNIYVGDSMVEDRSFDSLHLRNIRLWQLITMCGIVWELNRSRSGFPLPLDVAHLVLVQDFPIAIRFSNDEKRFGVDGAYNARYMIVKNRIDKAFVRGSSERLTQPGHIAIVYSQEKERREYLRYIDYLRAAGYVDGVAEDLEIESLQGVGGLRSLRIRVSASPPDMEVHTRPELGEEAAQRHRVEGGG